jgi:hypothetical protein
MKVIQPLVIFIVVLILFIDAIMYGRDNKFFEAQVLQSIALLLVLVEFIYLKNYY